MLYKLFRDNLPDYLVRHYWWAYLWRVSVWFFDHQPIINLILFGQYKRLMHHTLDLLRTAPQHSVLQLTCVYGSLTPHILELISPQELHITDVAPVQLQLAVNKTHLNNDSRQSENGLLATRMNAECLGYKSNSFTTVVIFFLLHELPADARARTLAETLRVLGPGGRLIITEYAALPASHFLYRMPFTRYLLTKYEPFLGDFWRMDMHQELLKAAAQQQKSLQFVSSSMFFSDFYRVLEFSVSMPPQRH